MSKATSCLAKPCRNVTSNPTGYCYAHEQLSMSVTPGGQYAIRHARGTDLGLKLAKESRVPIPVNSARVPGYPYFTTDDLATYRYFLQSGDEAYRPPTETIMDRFPVQVREVDGEAITGHEVGIYGGEDDVLFSFNQRVPVETRCARINDDQRVFATENDAQFMVHRSRKYQAVFIDEEIISAL